MTYHDLRTHCRWSGRCVEPLYAAMVSAFCLASMRKGLLGLLQADPDVSLSPEGFCLVII